MREEIKANIDFEGLQRTHPYDDVENLLELVVDMLGSTHIEYVIEAMRQTTTKINNIRAYLFTVLYNAPVTMGPYYSAAVRHDFG